MIVFGLGEVNETTLSSAGGGSAFIAKYNPNGTLAWVKAAEGNNSSSAAMANSVTGLNDGSCLITGGFAGAVLFGSGEENETILSSGTPSIFVAKYNQNGSLTWAKKTGDGNSYKFPSEIVALPDHSSLVVGYFDSTTTFGPGEDNETTLTSAGGNDIFILKLAP